MLCHTIFQADQSLNYLNSYDKYLDFIKIKILMNATTLHVVNNLIMSIFHFLNKSLDFHLIIEIFKNPQNY